MRHFIFFLSALALSLLTTAITPAYAQAAKMTKERRLENYALAVRCMAAAAFAKERNIPNDGGVRARGIAEFFGLRSGYLGAALEQDIKKRLAEETDMMEKKWRDYTLPAIEQCKGRNWL